MELTIATPREELVRKYRELCEKHARLLKQMEERATERVVVSKLSRALLRSTSSALALIEGRIVVAANHAWRLLDTPSEPREWNSAGDPPRTFASLAGAAVESAAPEIAPNGDVFVRCSDGVRVRLRVERLGGDSILAVAHDDAEAGVRLHRARNHMAAAMFQSRLLLEECGDPAAAPRAAAISELVRLAAEALEPNPQRPR